MRDYYQWCQELLNNWKQKDIDKIIDLFDEKKWSIMEHL